MTIEITRQDETQRLDSLNRGDGFVEILTGKLYILLGGTCGAGNLRSWGFDPLGVCHWPAGLGVLKVNMKIQWEVAQ